MPIHYEIRPEIDCIFITFEGTVDNHELLQAQQGMFNDPQFVGCGHYARLIDASLCDRLALDAITVHSAARAAILKGMKRAALVAPNDAVFGLMRMYDNYTASMAECRVFREISQAIDWLAQTHFPS